MTSEFFGFWGFFGLFCFFLFKEAAEIIMHVSFWMGGRCPEGLEQLGMAFIHRTVNLSTFLYASRLFYTRIVLTL